MISDEIFYSISYVTSWVVLFIICIIAVSIFAKWSTQGKVKNIIANATAIVIGLMIFVLSMEGFFAFIYDQTDSFGFLLTSQRWFKRYYRLNNLGFRDDKDYHYKKAPGVKRIVFIGDSFTAGHGIKSIENRFGGRIEQRLKGINKDYEVYTIAQNGWDTIHEVKTLAGLIDKGFEADLIVLCFNVNDIGLSSRNSYLTMKRISDKAPHSWLLTHSFFLNFIYMRLAVFSMPEFKDYFSWIADDYRGGPWQIEQYLLQEFIDLSNHRGYKVKAAIFPLIHDLKNEFKLRIAHEKLSEFFSDRRIPYVDFATSLSRFTEDRLVVNRFDSHPSKFAHLIIADGIWLRLIDDEIR